MRVIKVAKRKQLDFVEYKGRKPAASEIGDLLDEDTVVYEGGRPVLAYTILPKDILEEMREAVLTTDYKESNRALGLPTKSSVFGAMPRLTIRCDYCRFTKPTLQEQKNFERIIRFRDHVARFYSRYFPENYAQACAEAQQNIHPDWFVGNPSPWLTCNINVNFAIPYHKDAGNLASQFSNVIILRNNVTGGELVCPEFGISLSQRDGALAIFDGQSIIHGVRPIRVLGSSAGTYRASVVYYTMRDMQKCLSMEGEIDRAKNTRTAKERVPNEVRKAAIRAVSRGRMGAAK